MSEWKVTHVRGGDTLGKRILEARSELGITHAVIIKKYFIPLSFLEAIESGDYGRVPEKVYARAFLKKYLLIVGLPVNEHLMLFEEEYTNWQQFIKGERTGIRHERNVRGIELSPSFFQKVGVVAMGLVFLVYIGVRVDASIAPVDLEITSPEDRLTTSRRTLVIEGRAEPEATITINHQEIPIDNEGRFQKSVSLEEGLNILEVVAGKKYRPASTITRHVLVMPESS